MILSTYKTLTPEGERRKRNQLIAQFLEKTDPNLYIKLFKKAQKRIDNDNANPMARINAYGLFGTPHHTSDKVRKALSERDALTRALAEQKKAKKNV